MKDTITIGIPKGYLFKKTLEFFETKGIFVDDIPERALIFYDRTKKYKFLILRPTDVTVYVENGVVDMGICGMDIIIENDSELVVVKDLGFGYCRLSFACGVEDKDKPFFNGMKVATKFVKSATDYLREVGIKADIIKLYGSVELAAITGLSDFVVDLVATGETLKENNLVETKTIYETTAHLAVNSVFYSIHNDEVKKFIS